MKKIGWNIFKKSEVLDWRPTSKWRWNYYAQSYKKWEKYEVNTAWLINYKDSALQKALKGYKNTKTLFVFFIAENGEKKYFNDKGQLESEGGKK